MAPIAIPVKICTRAIERHQSDDLRTLIDIRAKLVELWSTYQAKDQRESTNPRLGGVSSSDRPEVDRYIL